MQDMFNSSRNTFTTEDTEGHGGQTKPANDCVQPLTTKDTKEHKGQSQTFATEGAEVTRNLPGGL
jgi:hypothetical protein